MARGEKPYRVYRGGRVRGRVPLETRRPRDERRRDGAAPGLPAPAPRPRRRRRWGRRIWLGVLTLLLLLVVWAVASFLALSSGLQEANKRLGPVALVPQDKLMLSTSTTILLVGTDHGPQRDRAGSRRSDSIMLIRTDPSRHRLAYLSIPRDLRALIPGYGYQKINAAFQYGGAQLASRTVRDFTGVPIHHMVVADFSNFRDLIDTVDGITVNVPEPIISNKFDCPYPTVERCERWDGWRFSRGPQRMDGRRALIYSRIRENRLNPADNDLTRGERQQAVLQALLSRLTSPRTLVRLPFIGSNLTKPLATDLTAGQLAQLGWLRFRSSESRALHCRLGGRAEGGFLVLEGDEKLAVLSMFLGRSAPQPPPPGSGPFGPGCVVGTPSGIGR